uniref:Uncharacterized protein n=1 Tax=Anopheles maculatus TaxID=74869 RepID=A0A182SPL4_9DIPT
MSTPALTRTKELDCLPHDMDTLSGPGEIVITAPDITQNNARMESKEHSSRDIKPEFVQTKSLDFEAQLKRKCALCASEYFVPFRLVPSFVAFCLSLSLSLSCFLLPVFKSSSSTTQKDRVLNYSFPKKFFFL